MSIIRKALTTDMLPAGFDDRQRFLTFAELFEHYSNTGELDAAEDVPFRATFACGFNDLSYFNRCFRRRFGLTPTAARGAR